METNEFENIDDIVSKIKGEEQLVVAQPVPEITDDNVNDYIYQKSTELVESNLATINALQQTIMQGAVPEEINALTSLVTATTKALDTLNKINLQNKQIKAASSNKKLELEARKDIASKRLPSTTNVLFATREEVMKSLSEPKYKTIE